MNKELIKTIFNLGYQFGADAERSFIKEQRNIHFIDWEVERIIKFLNDLKIEERELTKREQVELTMEEALKRGKRVEENNIPTKLITVTYKHKTVNIYE